MDSFGIGYSLDAYKFGDKGADTLGNIVKYRNSKNMILNLPNLAKRGLQIAAEASRGSKFSRNIFSGSSVKIEGKYGYCVEQSIGKDTLTGHWEIAGVIAKFNWYYFTKKNNTGSYFPKEILQQLSEKSIVQGFIDAGYSPGINAINNYGKIHCNTLKPIIYTSKDSVLQIAADEDTFGLDKLYMVCRTARQLFDEKNIKLGRVIARPFKKVKEKYVRTNNRKDYSILPIEKTLLNILEEAGVQVVGIGKISDIFANKGITRSVKVSGIKKLFDETINVYKASEANTFIFTNFSDFDSHFGHRRDIEGYANSLEYFDSRLSELDEILDADTIVIVTADHGCDPSWSGFDHTREHIPFLVWGKNNSSQDLGRRCSFSDVGQSISNFMISKKLRNGKSIF